MTTTKSCLKGLDAENKCPERGDAVDPTEPGEVKSTNAVAEPELSDLDDLDEFFRQIDKKMAERKLRLEHPYVKDLIEVLRPHSRGLARQIVLHTLEKKRQRAGLPIPRKFEQAVQSVYNHYCVDSVVFKKRRAPEAEGLFYSPQGKGSGVWAVHVDCAVTWLRAKLRNHA